MGSPLSKTSRESSEVQPASQKSKWKKIFRRSARSSSRKKKQQTAKEEEPDVLDHFPDPSTIPIVDVIPQKAGKYIKVEDTFWTKKRELIPDYSVMEKIDEHALKAPDSIRTSPDKLISYLLKPCKTDVEKVRVLVRWIGNNIAYDVAGKENPSRADCTIEGVLKNKRAICDGYASVLEMFCRLANIESEIISGQTKNETDINPDLRITPKIDHAWNRVKLNGDWYFVDSTWCAGGIGDRDFKKEWNEWWFLPDPEAFVYSHLPIDRDKSILTEQQMVEQPRLSSKEWDTKLEREPAAYAFGIEPVSHTDTRITTKENEIIFKYQCGEKLLHCAQVNFYNKNSSPDTANSCCVMYELDGMVHAHVRFQKPGVYIVKFAASVKHGDDVIKGQIGGLMYRITFEGISASPFHQELYGQLGLHIDYHDTGFQLLHPKSPVISTTTGFTTITVKLPTAGLVSNLIRFYKLEGSKSKGKNEVRGLVYCEKKGDIARLHIQCPKIGEYKLELYAKSKEGQSFSPAMTFLICCKGVNTPIHAHPTEGNFCNQLAGPDAQFYKTGLTTNQNSSTLQVVDDEAVLIIKRTRPARILVDLKSACELNEEEHLKIEENDEQLEITVKRPTMAGYYWLRLCSKEGTEGGLMTYAGCFCIPYQVPFYKQ